jgi:hypothetical protein
MVRPLLSSQFQHGLIGHFFMDHPSTKARVIIPQIGIYGLGAPGQHNSATRDRGGLMNAAETVRRPGRRYFVLVKGPGSIAGWPLAGAKVRVLQR